MEVVIRKPGKDLVKFLLDKALEDGFPVSVVRLNPDGLFVPIELAANAGLLDYIRTPTQKVLNDGPGRDAEPVKRTPRKRASKSTASTSEAEADPQAQSTDPWD